MEVIGLILTISFVVFIFGLYADSNKTVDDYSSQNHMQNGIDYSMVKKR